MDGPKSVILCDAPPETEKNAEFVSIASGFAQAGLRVPQVLSADLERGFLALEDLGDQTLLPLLDNRSVDGFYQQALGMLQDLAVADSRSFSLPPYDEVQLTRELSLFPEWFCKGLLALDFDAGAQAGFRCLEKSLCDRALGQTQVVVHRDFHARNLMVLDDGTLATIDFQDALLGPLTYDPVSLLKDCYLRWPDAQVSDWALRHHGVLKQRGVVVPSEQEFLRDFHFMGLQRHLKVLGIFARLFLRDGKPGYLRDLPRVIDYVRGALARYPEEPALAEFLRWFDDVVMPPVRRQSWFDGVT
jgi:aminoglycoside/choline kinase family phosphotransferase